MANFHKYNLEELSMKEYNELQDALKEHWMIFTEKLKILRIRIQT